MMVIPTQSHVTLYYGRTAANTVGQVLEGMAWILLLGLVIWRLVLWIRRRRFRDAVVGSGATVGSGTALAAEDHEDLDYRDQGRYTDAEDDDTETTDY